MKLININTHLTYHEMELEKGEGNFRFNVYIFYPAFKLFVLLHILFPIFDAFLWL